MELLVDPEYWKLLSIPLTAGLIGWVTNWVAIELTFKPLVYRGLRPFGWQGIIPSKAEKMGRIFVDSTMSRLGQLSELFEKMGPERVATHIIFTILPRLDAYTDEVMQRVDPSLWNRLPAVVKQQIYARVRAGLSERVEALMQEIGARFTDLIDFKHMVLERLTGDRALVNRLFLEPGRAEFAFIITSGLYFGMVFGAVQLAVWVVYPAWWTLPLFGFLVGWVTNYVALNVIFRPLRPVRVGPWRVQGLFLKRQDEVAAIWCHLVTREIVTIRNVVHEMLTGPRSATLHELIRAHLRPLVDNAVGVVGPLARAVVGADGFARIKESVGEKALALSVEPFEDAAFVEERATVIEYWLTRRMRQLPPEEFQDLLRPCFKEDEWKLLLLGGVLGLLAGLAQLLLLWR